VDVAQVVCRELILHRAQIHRFRSREVETALDTAVEDDAVEVRVFLVDGSGPCWDAFQIGNVEGSTRGFGVAVLGNEGLDGFSAAAGDDDLAAFGDELFGEALADA